MKKRLLTALLIATMTLITACGNAEVPTENDTTATTVSVTEQITEQVTKPPTEISTEKGTEQSTEKILKTLSQNALIYSDDKFNIKYKGIEDNEIKFEIRNKTDKSYFFTSDKNIQINNKNYQIQEESFILSPRYTDDFSIYEDSFPTDINSIDFNLVAELLLDNLTKIHISVNADDKITETGTSQSTLLYENEKFSISYERAEPIYYSPDNSKLYFLIKNKTNSSYSFDIKKIKINKEEIDNISSSPQTIYGNSENEIIVSEYDFSINDIDTVGLVFTYFIENNSKDYKTISVPEKNVYTEKIPELSTEKVTEKTNSDTGTSNSVYDNPQQQNTTSYVLNTHTKKIHKSSCGDVKRISPENYATTNDLNQALADGYSPCQRCNP